MTYETSFCSDSVTFEIFAQLFINKIFLRFKLLYSFNISIKKLLLLCLNCAC